MQILELVEEKLSGSITFRRDDLLQQVVGCAIFSVIGAVIKDSLIHE